MQLNPLIVGSLGERAARLYELLKAAHAEAKPDEKITLKSLRERFGWEPWKFQRDRSVLRHCGWIEIPWHAGRHQFTRWKFPDVNQDIIENSTRCGKRKNRRCKPKS